MSSIRRSVVTGSVESWLEVGRRVSARPTVERIIHPGRTFGGIRLSVRIRPYDVDVQDHEPWTTGRLRTWIRDSPRRERGGVSRRSAPTCSFPRRSVRSGFVSTWSLIVWPATKSVRRSGTWVKRASNHEPVQYLVGEAWFHQARIEVDASTMIPRPATETLVEVGHRRSRRRGFRPNPRSLHRNRMCFRSRC